MSWEPVLFQPGTLATAKSGTVIAGNSVTPTIVRGVVLCNTDSVSRTCNLYVTKNGVSSNIIAEDTALAAGAVVSFTTPITLAAEVDSLTGDASAVDVVTHAAWGVVRQ